MSFEANEWADTRGASPSAHAAPPANTESHDVERTPYERIRITDAVTSSEFSPTGYIVYVIDSQDNEAKRRYSEFEALRDALVQLHPTLIIPPIPSKHSLADYALKQNRAKDDPTVLARRKRMLQRFLNRCDAHPVLCHDPVFQRFLDPRFSWHEIKTSPPISTLPPSTLHAPPQCPADPEAPLSYRALPTPPGVRKLRNPNARFEESEAFTTRFETVMTRSLETSERRLTRRWRDLSADYAELGALFNAQSLSESPHLAPAIERVGQAADATYMAYNDLLSAWEANVSEPLHEYTQYGKILQGILKWRHLKHQQLELAQDSLVDKKQQLAELEHMEAEYARLSRAMEIGGQGLNTRPPPTPPRTSVYGRAAEEETGEAAEPSATAHTAPHLHALPPTPSRRGMLSALAQRFQNVMDMDPDKTRQSTISRLREEVLLLSEGVQLAEKDLQQATDAIQASLDRFQRLKVDDMRHVLLASARLHRDLCYHVCTYANAEPASLAARS